VREAEEESKKKFNYNLGGCVYVREGLVCVVCASDTCDVSLSVCLCVSLSVCVSVSVWGLCLQIYLRTYIGARIHEEGPYLIYTISYVAVEGTRSAAKCERPKKNPK